jgi:hypothetical protein
VVSPALPCHRIHVLSTSSHLNASPACSHSYTVSQFTLLASTKKGNKPDFHQSASGVKAKTLYQSFFKQVQDQYQPERVKDGLFAAMMDVALVNDGPVGLDYTCLDNEVQPRNLIGRVFSLTHMLEPLLTRRRPGYYSNRHRAPQVAC